MVEKKLINYYILFILIKDFMMNGFFGNLFNGIYKDLF